MALLRRASYPTVLAAAAILGIGGCTLFHGPERTSGYVDDAAITARVKQALVQDPNVKANEVDVHTVGGKVSLNGVVESLSMAQRAEQVAERTPGVRSVQNALQVESASAADTR
jgi:hyperosmotically inducible protein